MAAAVPVAPRLYCYSLPLALLVILAAASAAAGDVAARRILQEQEVPLSVQHELWMKAYGRVYKDDVEKARRFQVFKANAEYVSSVNRAGGRTYTLGLNKFADLTTDEVNSQLGGRLSKPPTKTAAVTRSFKEAAHTLGLPDSVNWVAQGAVTGIKDQEQCGCCWAFAAVAATESAVQIANGQLMSLSEQQVLDCTGSRDTCAGGYLTDAFSYIQSSGLTTESMYPYTGSQETCSANTSPVAYVSGHTMVTAGDETALQSAVAMQPVAVGIDASEQSFQMYHGGIYSGDVSCGSNMDHAVVVVGYGTDNGMDYWLLKNQWGTSWGEGGYMRIMRGADCGLTMEPVYPTAA